MKVRTMDHATTRALTKKDLDDRIGEVATELFAVDVDGQDWTPMPIGTAEFVRRMKPFLVYN